MTKISYSLILIFGACALSQALATSLFLPSFYWQNKNSNLVVSAEVLRVEAEKCTYVLQVIKWGSKTVLRDELHINPQEGQEIVIRNSCAFPSKDISGGSNFSGKITSAPLLPPLNLKTGDKGLFMLFLNERGAETVSLVGLDLGFFMFLGESFDSVRLSRVLPSYFSKITWAQNKLAEQNQTDLTYDLINYTHQEISIDQFEKWLNSK